MYSEELAWDAPERVPAMRRNESFYRHLLHECQSDDRERRLRALDGLGTDEYLDLVEGQFLLDRLNSTSEVQEQVRNQPLTKGQACSLR